MCQLDWAKGCPDETFSLVASVRIFPDGISIRISELSKGDVMLLRSSPLDSYFQTLIQRNKRVSDYFAETVVEAGIYRRGHGCPVAASWQILSSGRILFMLISGSFCLSLCEFPNILLEPLKLPKFFLINNLVINPLVARISLFSILIIKTLTEQSSFRTH